jgi:hypothetical protein
VNGCRMLLLALLVIGRTIRLVLTDVALLGIVFTNCCVLAPMLNILRARSTSAQSALRTDCRTVGGLVLVMGRTIRPVLLLLVAVVLLWHIVTEHCRRVDFARNLSRAMRSTSGFLILVFCETWIHFPRTKRTPVLPGSFLKVIYETGLTRWNMLNDMFVLKHL